MPGSRHLQISPSPAAGPALSPDQKRFDALISQIGLARATLAAWHAQIPLYHQAHLRRIEPLIVQVRQARRDALFVLDALYDQPHWTKAEVGTLREVILDRLDELITSASGAVTEPALKALVDKHGEADPGCDRPASRQQSAGRGEALTGVDLGPADGIDSDADLMNRLQAELDAWTAVEEARREAAKATSRTARGGKPRGKRASAAQLRRDAEAQQATRSVREVYRKLASALHPDREPDATQRDAKTGLMQRVNSAYASDDLLALLELQLESLQVDAAEMRGANAQRLEHYNRVLAEQLRELKLEAERVQLQFELDFGIDARGPLNPMKLGRLVDEGYRDMSALLADHQREARILSDRAATRQWLKRMRTGLHEAAMDNDFF